MKKLDDSWNAQDLETFKRYHTKDCIVRWAPTEGIRRHGLQNHCRCKISTTAHPVVEERAGGLIAALEV